jgi:hypothetical protein
VIFSGGRGAGGRHHRSGDPGRSGRHVAGRQGPEGADDHLDEDSMDGHMPPGGPYDVAEAPGGVQRLDLGSLLIPVVDGVEVRVQANPDGAIQQVVLVHGDSALQLGVFAAPRTAGIWDEVRTEIRKSLFDDGVAAEEAPGEYGTELRARVRTPEGMTDIRFIGIDGPRWMVRAVYQGRAAVNPQAAGPLAACLRELVVDRGREAMPVREALPLRLPREMAEQAQVQRQEAGEEPGQQPSAESPNGRAEAPGASASRRRPSPRPRRSK